jgi:hypothetical protein
LQLTVAANNSGFLLPFASRSKTTPPNEPPCRDQLKDGWFSVLEMRVKRGSFELVPHPSPPVSPECRQWRKVKTSRTF